MHRRLITTRALLITACAGALAATAPVAAARPAADPGALVGTWTRVVTQSDIDRTASFREEPKGWFPALTGPYTLVLANGSFAVRDKKGFAVAETTRVDSAGAFDVLSYISPDIGAFCPQWIPQNASYTWAMDGSELVLTAADDKCSDRSSILAGRWAHGRNLRTIVAKLASEKDGKKAYRFSDKLTEGGAMVGTDSGGLHSPRPPRRRDCRLTVRFNDGTLTCAARATSRSRTSSSRSSAAPEPMPERRARRPRGAGSEEVAADNPVRLTDAAESGSGTKSVPGPDCPPAAPEAALACDASMADASVSGLTVSGATRVACVIGDPVEHSGRRACTTRPPRHSGSTASTSRCTWLPPTSGRPCAVCGRSASRVSTSRCRTRPRRSRSATSWATRHATRGRSTRSASRGRLAARRPDGRARPRRCAGGGARAGRRARCRRQRQGCGRSPAAGRHPEHHRRRAPARDGRPPGRRAGRSRLRRQGRGGGDSACGAGGLLVHCTPVGGIAALKQLPVPADVIERMDAVADFAYRADGSPTPLAEVALAAGLPVVDGLELLVRQGALRSSAGQSSSRRSTSCAARRGANERDRGRARSAGRRPRSGRAGPSTDPPGPAPADPPVRLRDRPDATGEPDRDDPVGGDAPALVARPAGCGRSDRNGRRDGSRRRLPDGRPVAGRRGCHRRAPTGGERSG